MLQSVSADSQIDCRARIAFWLRTSISFSLSCSLCLSIYFSFFLPMLVLFLSIFSLFPLLLLFLSQNLFQYTFLIFPPTPVRRSCPLQTRSIALVSTAVWRNAWVCDVGNALSTALQMGCRWRIDRTQKLIKSFQENVPWIQHPGHQSTARPSLL